MKASTKKRRPGLRRQAAGRDMRRIDQAEMFEVAHHIATVAGDSDDGSMRDRLREPSGSPSLR